MPKYTSIPPPLVGQFFGLRAAKDSGLGEHRLRKGDLDRPFAAVRASGRAIATIRDACEAYEHRMPEPQFFSHLTAARLWGLPAPRRFSEAEPLHVSVVRPTKQPGSRGVVGHRLADENVRVQMVSGHPTADVDSTLCHLAGCWSFDDLIAAIDSAILSPVYPDAKGDAERGEARPFTTLARLTARSRRFHGRGKRMLVEAIALARAGSESPNETKLRLLLSRAGLPEPELNAAVADRYDPSVDLGRVDLLYREWQVVVEYDGDQHRTDTAQYERDQVRHENLRAAGFTTVPIRWSGLTRTPQQTVARVIRALRAAGYPG